MNLTAQELAGVAGLLSGAGVEPVGPLSSRLIAGGRSNLTFLLTDGFLANRSEDPDVRYGELALVLADDRLWVNTASSHCSELFAVERAALRREAGMAKDCGGRAPSYSASNQRPWGPSGLQVLRGRCLWLALVASAQAVPFRARASR